jgi:EAL domain-containing protein (putative c-di-GMP-specific phosphodiesterase class I)
MKRLSTSSTSGSAVPASIWFLTGQSDASEQVRLIPIRSVPFLVGRRSDSALCLRQNCVSKKHAELSVSNDQLRVRDLESTNGTYVNGERISAATGLNPGDIVQFATVVFRVSRTEHFEEDANELGTIHEDTYDQAMAMVQLERLINDRAVVPYFQPIVRVDDSTNPLSGYEVLGRSDVLGMTHPREMFHTASQLNLETELSRVFRMQGLELGQALGPNVSLFFNTHPAELLGTELGASLQELRAEAPDRPMVLEIHEAAVTSPQMIRSLRDDLNDLRIQLAFDDFGAGQARLLELADVRPDFIKFDMKLVQGIHQAPASRQQVVALLVRMLNELGIVPVAEGVENAEEHLTLCQMGVQMGQGYYYGRPGSIDELLA